jgi:1,4-alpha-glucan branching enzyme
LTQALATEGNHRVDYLQNHDQVGNRPFGDRITRLASREAVRAAAAVLMLAPPVPLIFMGEEWAASSPFLFFCDFEPNLARRVTQGRRDEFAGLAEFGDPAALQAIPDPAAPETFERSKLAWNERERPEHREWLDYYRELLRIRRESIVPHLSDALAYDVRTRHVGATGFTMAWRLPGGTSVAVDANLGPAPQSGFDERASATVVFSTHGTVFANGTAPPWSVRWSCGE